MINKLKTIFITLSSNYWIFKFNFIISLFFLWLTPVSLLLWLIFFTIYLNYFKKLTWSSLIKTWSPILSVWYLILIIGLLNYTPIIIGPGYTEDLILKIVVDEIYFERICISTIILFHAFSCLIGLPIIIPLLNVSKWISRTSCAEDEYFKKKDNSTETSRWFSGVKTQTQKDNEMCCKLADRMAKTQYRKPFYQHEKMESEDGERVTHNVSSRVPGFGLFNFCFTTSKKYDSDNRRKDK